MLAAGPTYLTGPTAIGDAVLACFEVDEILTLEIRKLAQHLRTLGVGQLEIKKRGIDVDPEKLRRDLKLRGSNAATLLITQIAGKPTAILAHRIAAGTYSVADPSDKLEGFPIHQIEPRRTLRTRRKRTLIDADHH